MQSQDYAAAKWALGLRARRATEAALDRLFDAGAILRTHVMRPTWHFVLPGDIRWLLELTGPRVRLGLAGRHRRLEIDRGVTLRAGQALTAALAGGRHLTRPQLGDALRRAGVAPDGQRLPHLLMTAELDGLIVSGPRRGRQHTYALLEERVPRASVWDRTEALAELARRYFRSHGPARLHDFAWWSGLLMADLRTGIALAGAALGRQTVDGVDHWFDAAAGPAPTLRPIAHLLPSFDEYTVAYRHRTAALPPPRHTSPVGSILANVVAFKGVVRGVWRRTKAAGGVRVEVRVPDRLEPAEVAAVEAAGRRLGRFLERPVEVVWNRR